MNTFRLFIIAVCCLWLIPFSGCHKNKDSQNNNQPVQGTAYHITHTGEPYKDSAISFSSDVPAGISYRWQFGDGDTSTLSQPKHTYDSAGKFLVTLVLNNDAGFTFKDSIAIGFHKFDLLPGTKTWHHTYMHPSPWAQIEYAGADTSFSIDYIDPIRVKISNDTLVYTSMYTVYANPDSALVFCKLAGPIDYNKFLTYNCITNKVSYHIQWHVSAGAGDGYENYVSP